MCHFCVLNTSQSVVTKRMCKTNKIHPTQKGPYYRCLTSVESSTNWWCHDDRSFLKDYSDVKLMITSNQNHHIVLIGFMLELFIHQLFFQIDTRFHLTALKFEKQKLLSKKPCVYPVTICILSAFIIFDNIRIANSNR